MNTKQLIASLSLAVVGASAFAGYETTPNLDRVSQLTRSEVRAELARAQAAGELNPNLDAGHSPVVSALHGRSREDVRAEARDVVQASATGHRAVVLRVGS